MKPFAGFKSEASNGKVPPLPAGPYVAKIINTKIEQGQWGDSLILRLDVAEGPLEGYWTKRYKRENASGRYEAKYKGDFRIRIPVEGDEYYDSNLRKFNDAMFRIEQSNPGYRWDWDETGLIGKIVGINMQDAEYNGSAFTRIGRLEIAQDVRAGIVQPMTPKDGFVPHQNEPNTVPAGYTQVEPDDGPPF